MRHSGIDIKCCNCDCHKPWSSVVHPVCLCTCNVKVVQPWVYTEKNYFENINSRIENLEKYKSKKIHEDTKISTIIDELEDFKKRQVEWNQNIRKEIDDLDNFTDSLSKNFEDEINELYKNIRKLEKLVKDKKPHKCPICDGLGGFYVSGTMDEQCHSCNGKGIVWG